MAKGGGRDHGQAVQTDARVEHHGSGGTQYLGQSFGTEAEEHDVGEDPLRLFRRRALEAASFDGFVADTDHATHLSAPTTEYIVDFLVRSDGTTVREAMRDAGVLDRTEDSPGAAQENPIRTVQVDTLGIVQPHLADTVSEEDVLVRLSPADAVGAAANNPALHALAAPVPASAAAPQVPLALVPVVAQAVLAANPGAQAVTPTEAPRSYALLPLVLILALCLIGLGFCVLLLVILKLRKERTLSRSPIDPVMNPSEALTRQRPVTATEPVGIYSSTLGVSGMGTRARTASMARAQFVLEKQASLEHVGEGTQDQEESPGGDAGAGFPNGR